MRDEEFPSHPSSLIPHLMAGSRASCLVYGCCLRLARCLRFAALCGLSTRLTIHRCRNRGRVTHGPVAAGTSGGGWMAGAGVAGRTGPAVGGGAGVIGGAVGAGAVGGWMAGAGVGGAAGAGDVGPAVASIGTRLIVCAPLVTVNASTPWSVACTRRGGSAVPPAGCTVRSYH